MENLIYRLNPEEITTHYQPEAGNRQQADVSRMIPQVIAAYNEGRVTEKQLMELLPAENRVVAESALWVICEIGKAKRMDEIQRARTRAGY